MSDILLSPGIVVPVFDVVCKPSYDTMVFHGQERRVTTGFLINAKALDFRSEWLGCKFHLHSEIFKGDVIISSLLINPGDPIEMDLTQSGEIQYHPPIEYPLAQIAYQTYLNQQK